MEDNSIGSLLHQVDKKLDLLVAHVLVSNGRISKVEAWQENFWRHFLAAILGVTSCSAIIISGMLWLFRLAYP